MIYPIHNFVEDRSYSAVVIKDQQRFWKRILIVDDDIDVTMTFKEVIEESNNDVDVNKRIEVYTSNDPVVSLSEFKPNFHDLLLVDINMPRMNGFELSEKILAIDINVRICFMSNGEINRERSSDFLDLWNIVNGNWNLYKKSVTQILPYQGANTTTPSALKTTTKEIDQFRKKQFESMAADLIASSDRLVNQLAFQTDKNSNDLMLLQILFAVLIVSILILILYLVARMLKPIFDLTQATSKI